MMNSIKNTIIHFMFVLAILANTMALVFKREGSFIISMGSAIVGITIMTSFSNFKRIKTTQLLFALYCIILLTFSMLPADTIQAQKYLGEHFRWFILAGVGSLFIVNYKYDYELSMKLLIISSLFIAPVVLTSNYSKFNYYVENDEWMMAIYNIIPLLVASISYQFFGQKTIIKIISVISLVMYFPMFIIHTPRGAVVTILFSIIIFTIQKLLTQGVGRKKLITTGIIIIVFMIITFEVIVGYLQNVASLYELRWLSKFVFEEDVSNGRTSLYQMALNGFFQSPLWGNGIASFNNYSIYPHNLFLQMLYETGVLMFIPVSYLIYKAFMIMILKRESSIDYRLITFLFIISIIQLSFSSHFWMRQQFWMLIWIMLSMVPLKNSRRRK